MKTTNINQTVLSANPVSAHRMESAGAGVTRTSVDAIVTPTMPTTEPGIGSVIRAMMTPVKSAK
jgi:hypothetical protein